MLIGLLFYMKDFRKNFPLELSRTKVAGLDQEFDLSDVKDRQVYFNKKAGEEIKKLKEYFKANTFIAYWLGKKNAGKGTYSKLMMEIFGQDKIAHISVGDVVRDTHAALETEEGKKEITDFLNREYRGYISVEEGIEAILNRSQDKVSVPNEIILALVKREIDKHEGKIIFIDGFPRTLDQISYSLYFRALINYREDPDIFIAIDVPESVIDERMKSRVVCPLCKIPRSLKLLTTKSVGHDAEKDEYYLKCDNPDCPGEERMGAKEGDNQGIESIRARLDLDEELIKKIFSLHGIPKILLRNAIPVKEAEKLVDKYEITPEYYYEKDGKRIITKTRHFTVKDDEGIESYSLLASAVVLSLIKQLVKIFKL